MGWGSRRAGMGWGSRRAGMGWGSRRAGMGWESNRRTRSLCNMINHCRRRVPKELGMSYSFDCW